MVSRLQVDWRMVSSGMLRRVALVRTDVMEELSAAFIGVTRIGELGTTLAVTSNRRTLRNSSETSVLTRATRRNIPEDTIIVTAVKTSNLTAGSLSTSRQAYTELLFSVHFSSLHKTFARLNWNLIKIRAHKSKRLCLGAHLWCLYDRVQICYR
jgi:hypothetical protein